MIRGIGVDTVNIQDIQRFLGEQGIQSAYARHTFTPAERDCAERSSDAAEYLASRFAAKEAVFKALAHLTEKHAFDLRIVETLNAADGAPYINAEPLQELMASAGVSRFYISITTEDQYATAFVVAET